MSLKYYFYHHHHHHHLGFTLLFPTFLVFIMADIHSTPSFYHIPKCLQTNFGIAPLNGSRPIPATSSQMYYSLIKLPFDAMYKKKRLLKQIETKEKMVTSATKRRSGKQDRISFLDDRKSIHIVGRSPLAN